MAEKKRGKTAKEAFYREVGGPEAPITRNAGLSAVTRLLAMQVREAVGVNPAKIDRGTRDLINSVDGFYGVRGRKKFAQPAGSESNSAKKVYEIASAPPELLEELRTNIDAKFGPIEEKGILGKIVSRLGRERVAAQVSRQVVASKVKTLFK